MYYPAAEKIDGQIIWHGTVGATKAAPGNYSFKIKADNDSTEGNFVIKANPTYKLTQQDYDEQFNFLITVKDKFDEIQKAIKKIKIIRKQINDFTELQGKDYPKEVKLQADTIQKQITLVEETLHQTKAKSEQDVLNFPIRLDDKISGLYDFASSGNAAPARQVKETYAELSAQVDAALNKLKTIMDVDVVKLNEMIRQKALPIIGDKKE
jgi:hypothetical protein